MLCTLRQASAGWSCSWSSGHSWQLWSAAGGRLDKGEEDWGQWSAVPGQGPQAPGAARGLKGHQSSLHEQGESECQLYGAVCSIVVLKHLRQADSRACSLKQEHLALKHALGSTGTCCPGT